MGGLGSAIVLKRMMIKKNQYYYYYHEWSLRATLVLSIDHYMLHDWLTNWNALLIVLNFTLFKYVKQSLKWF